MGASKETMAASKVKGVPFLEPRCFRSGPEATSAKGPLGCRVTTVDAVVPTVVTMAGGVVLRVFFSCCCCRRCTLERRLGRAKDPGIVAASATATTGLGGGASPFGQIFSASLLDLTTTGGAATVGGSAVMKNLLLRAWQLKVKFKSTCSFKIDEK